MLGQKGGISPELFRIISICGVCHCAVRRALCPAFPPHFPRSHLGSPCLHLTTLSQLTPAKPYPDPHCQPQVRSPLYFSVFPWPSLDFTLSISFSPSSRAIFAIALCRRFPPLGVLSIPQHSRSVTSYSVHFHAPPAPNTRFRLPPALPFGVLHGSRAWVPPARRAAAGVPQGAACLHASALSAHLYGLLDPRSNPLPSQDHLLPPPFPVTQHWPAADY